MISNYRYYSFKELHFRGTVPYIVFVFAVVLLVLIAQNPHEVLLTMAIIYVASGPLWWLYRRQLKPSQPKAGQNQAGKVAVLPKSGKESPEKRNKK
jgi:CDP-diacylglycerol--serine O-phosphatidyltransferase